MGVQDPKALGRPQLLSQATNGAGRGNGATGIRTGIRMCKARTLTTVLSHQAPEGCDVTLRQHPDLLRKRGYWERSVEVEIVIMHPGEN